MRVSVLMLVFASTLVPSSAVKAQSAATQNPGISTTPGLTQPSSPIPTLPTGVTNIQNLPAGTPRPTNGTPPPSLGYIPISNPVVLPGKFASANVLSTQAPNATVQQPLPPASYTTPAVTNTISPQMATFTFTPSQQFQPIVTPTPFLPPSQTPFKAK